MLNLQGCNRGASWIAGWWFSSWPSSFFFHLFMYRLDLAALFSGELDSALQTWWIVNLRSDNFVNWTFYRETTWAPKPAKQFFCCEPAQNWFLWRWNYRKRSHEHRSLLSCVSNMPILCPSIFRCSLPVSEVSLFFMLILTCYWVNYIDNFCVDCRHCMVIHKHEGPRSQLGC